MQLAEINYPEQYVIAVSSGVRLKSKIIFKPDLALKHRIYDLFTKFTVLFTIQISEAEKYQSNSLHQTLI
jgi:hypothetical protein